MAEWPVAVPRDQATDAEASAACNRCGYPIREVRAWGCKNPCANCGTVYPLGDCSD